MLSERKKKILQAIVEEYVETAEPVSSGNLLKKNHLDISSATIRNEMAELEQAGLLDKPHTSAGRVPSAQGYRYYVDQLIKEDKISLEEIEYIKSKLETRAMELEDVTKIVTNTLAEVTHYTSLAIGPDNAQQIISELKFVLLGSRILMAIILTENGLIKETMIKFEEDITEEQVQHINVIFNNKLKGKPLSEISKPMEEYIISEMKNEINIIKSIIEQINKAIVECKNVYLKGAKNILDMPEFNEVDKAKSFLDIVDKKEFLKNLEQEESVKDINVYIGDENGNEKLKDYSIVTFKHVVNGKDLGTIGIIGPTRMNYAKVISIMKYINKELNNNNKED